MASVLSEAYFHHEDAAFAALEAILWPDGPVCPHCGVVGRAGKLQGVKDKNGNVFREPSNWARTPYDAQDFPDTWKTIIADQWGEGSRTAMGRNACVPTYGFPMSLVTEPAELVTRTV